MSLRVLIVAALVGLPFLGAPATAFPTTFESEPNDSWAEADVFAIGAYVGGNCQSGIDVVGADLAAQRVYSFDVSPKNYALGSVAVIHLLGPNGKVIRDDLVRDRASYPLVALDPGVYAVSIECGWSGGPWELTIGGGGPAPPIAGPDEFEHNDRAEDASWIPLSMEAEGRADPRADPVDFWAVNATAGQGVRVVFTSGTEGATLAMTGAIGDAPDPVGDVLTAVVSGGGPFVFAVTPENSGGNYTLGVEVLDDASMFSQGPAELEPNNKPAQATSISGSDNASYEGQLTPAFDSNDIFALTAEADVTVMVNLTFESACGIGCPEVRVERPDGLARLDPYDDPIVGENVTFAASKGATWHLNVSGANALTNYTLAVSVVNSPYTFHEVVDLIVAMDSPEFAGVLTGVDTGCQSPGRAVNFAICGNGIMYGGSIELYFTNYGPVALMLRVPAGLRLDPDEDGVANYVVTRSQLVEAPAWATRRATIVACPEGPARYAPSSLTIFDPLGMATGNGAAITNLTSNGTYDAKVEAVAYWAGVSGVSHQELREWLASEDTIAAAGELLATAGVASSITPRPPPPPAASGGFPWAAVFLSLGVIGVVVLLGAAWAANKRKARTHAQLPFMPPGTGILEQPGGRAQAWAPYARPPESSSSSPPSPSAPSAGSQMPAAVSYARVVETAPSSASPAAAGTAGLEGTAPCPQCGAPVGVRASQCTACGLALVWD